MRFPTARLPGLAFLLTPLLAWAAFPPGRLPEAAFVLLVPGLVWSRRAPAWRAFLAGQWVAWFITWLLLLLWLRHVTVAGMVLLAAFLAFFPAGWFVAVRWLLRRGTTGATVLGEAVAGLGLAGLWVVLDWLRGWVGTGFPWLPLAATQWERPLMLGLAPHLGTTGVTFLLVLFNLGIAGYLERLTLPRERRRGWFSPGLALALALLLGGTFGLMGDYLRQPREPWLRVGIVQPYIPQHQKWDERFAREVLQTLERETLRVAALEPDFLVWPEAATPWVLGADPGVRAWLEDLTRRAGRPLLAGVVVREEDGDWFNAAVVIDPEQGLQPDFYAKRHLVPFGEYVPLRPLLGWLSKFVPIGDDFQRGASAAPLVVSAPGGPVEAGILICYEDVFPGLARANVAAGAGLLVNVTNNAWYGEGAAAYQHAAHSVLRAAETRRPVLRCGNGGWSGWIDEFGAVRAVLLDERGSVYFRGGEVVEVTRDPRWTGRETPFTRHGDRFVFVAAALAAAAFGLGLRRPRLDEA